MKLTLSNDMLGTAILGLLISLFVGVRSYMKRRNGLLAFIVGLFTFSICRIVGEFILPIPFFYEPDANFVLERSITYLEFDEYLWEMLSERIWVFFYFLLFAFFLRSLFRPMQKIWKALFVIVPMLAGIVGYCLLRNLLYGTVVANVDFYSITMAMLGAVWGYLLSFLMGKFCLNIYEKMSLAHSPKRTKQVSYLVDLE